MIKSSWFYVKFKYAEKVSGALAPGGLLFHPTLSGTENFPAVNWHFWGSGRAPGTASRVAAPLRAGNSAQIWCLWHSSIFIF